MQMPITGDTGLMEHDTWQRLLDGLQERIPDFVERFIGEIQARGLYDLTAVPLEDIRRTADDAIRMLIERLRGDELTGTEFIESLGRRRARQGVPLERLATAIRLDLRLIWEQLLEIAQPDSTEVLVRNVERLITVVDRYVNDVHRAFLGEMAILQRDSRLATEQHLSRLFNEGSANAELLQEIATGIGVDPGAEFELLVLPNASEEHRSKEVSSWLAKREVLAYMYRGWLLLFRPHADATSSWPEEFAGIPAVYVDRVEGLRALPAAARAAVDLQTLAAPIRRLVRIEEFWALGAASHLETLIPAQTRPMLKSLAEVPDDERERMLRTVRIFLHSGSIKETAAHAVCHRNTVINRFKLFQSCTGLDVTVPAQAALAFVLLAGATGEFDSPLTRSH